MWIHTTKQNLNRPPLSTLLATVYVQIIPIHHPHCTWLLLSTSEAERILMKLDLTRPQELSKKHNHHSRVRPIWADMLLYAPFEAGRLADYSWYFREKVFWLSLTLRLLEVTHHSLHPRYALFASKIHGVQNGLGSNESFDDGARRVLMSELIVVARGCGGGMAKP